MHCLSLNIVVALVVCDEELKVIGRVFDVLDLVYVGDEIPVIYLSAARPSYERSARVTQGLSGRLGSMDLVVDLN